MNLQRGPFLLLILLTAMFFPGGCASMDYTQINFENKNQPFDFQIKGSYREDRDFSDITLNCVTNRAVTVYVNDEKVLTTDKSSFPLDVHWVVGSPILVRAEDGDGHVKEIKYWPDREPPDKPDGLRVVRSNPNLIELEWNENRESDIKGYRVYYGLKNGPMREVHDIVNDARYEIIGLKNFNNNGNLTFQFYVRAVDMMENQSDDSDVLEVTVPDQ